MGNVIAFPVRGEAKPHKQSPALDALADAIVKKAAHRGIALSRRAVSLTVVGLVESLIATDGA